MPISRKARTEEAELRYVSIDAALPTPAEIRSLVEEPPLRYAPFFERVASLLGASEEMAREALRDEAFERPGLPGLEIKPLPFANPNDTQRAMLLRFAAGARCPKHLHCSRERVLVLEGGYRDCSGQRFRPGDIQEMEPGSAHALRIDDDGPCVAVAVTDRETRFTSPLLRLLARLSI